MTPAYFITFHTYGTWLHGDARGSVDDEHNEVGSPFVPQQPRLEEHKRRSLAGGAITLDANRRWVVDRTIRDVATFRGWTLHALNVRTTHVHLVLTADRAPERVMNELKSWCTRRMVEHGVLERGRVGWSRHGSTRWLNDANSLAGAIGYVANRQGAVLPIDAPSREREAKNETPP